MAQPGVALDDLSRPRRVATAELLTEILATERDLADLYARFAEATELPALRAALSDLARAKRERVARLEPLLRALGGDSVAVAPPAGPRPCGAGVEGRGHAFARAFRGERALEVLYREIAALLAAGGLPPGLPELIAGAAQHRALLRELYLSYS
ncbi:MAG: hypothetical protein HY002_09520 [Candidatus Rokubacteria bacterium]|nr:hypothetical protein [Candidatus Rokubacteria bacterium]